MYTSHNTTRINSDLGCFLNFPGDFQERYGSHLCTSVCTCVRSWLRSRLCCKYTCTFRHHSYKLRWNHTDSYCSGQRDKYCLAFLRNQSHNRYNVQTHPENIQCYSCTYICINTKFRVFIRASIYLFYELRQ